LFSRIDTYYYSYHLHGSARSAQSNPRDPDRDSKTVTSRADGPN